MNSVDVDNVDKCVDKCVDRGKGAGMRRNIYKIITCLMIIAVLNSTTAIPIQAQKLSRYDGVYLYKIEKSTEGRAIYAKEIHYRIEEGYKREYL